MPSSGNSEPDHTHWKGATKLQKRALKLLESCNSTDEDLGNREPLYHGNDRREFDNRPAFLTSSGENNAKLVCVSGKNTLGSLIIPLSETKVALQGRRSLRVFLTQQQSSEPSPFAGTIPGCQAFVFNIDRESTGQPNLSGPQFANSSEEDREDCVSGTVSLFVGAE
jgi:hypothetical protein